MKDRKPETKTVEMVNIASVTTRENTADSKPKKQAKEQAAKAKAEAKATEREALLAARTKAIQLVKAIKEETAKKIKDVKEEAASKIAEATKGLKMTGVSRPTGDGPGIIASIVEFLSEANKSKPLSKAALLAKLAERFKDRDTNGMKRTVHCQLPGRLVVSGFNVVKCEGGYFIQK